jgi:hypothetical protein
MSDRTRHMAYRLLQVADLAAYPAICLLFVVTYGPRYFPLCFMASPNHHKYIPLEIPASLLSSPRWEPPCLGQYITMYPLQRKPRYQLHFAHLIMFDSDYAIQVSGLYGPGTYLSWLLTAISTLVSFNFQSESRQSDNQAKYGINADIIVSIIYPLAVCGDLLYRSFTYQRHLENACQDCPASFTVVAQTTWFAAILLVLMIGPKRMDRVAENRQLMVLYLAFWSCKISYLLARRRLLFPIWVSSVPLILALRAFLWRIITLEIPVYLLLSIPLILYYRSSARIHSRTRLLVIMISVILLYNPLLMFIIHLHSILYTYLLFRPAFPERQPDSIFRSIIALTTHPDYIYSQFTMIVPATNHNLRDLDQLAALVTTIIVLSWQWKAWRWPGVAIRKVKARFRLNRPLISDPVINLENLGANTDPNLPNSGHEDDGDLTMTMSTGVGREGFVRGRQVRLGPLMASTMMSNLPLLVLIRSFFM